MKRYGIRQFVIAVISTSMVVAQFSPALAAQPQSQVRDIALSENGDLVGHVVDAAGNEVKDAQVVVIFDGKPVASTQTDEQGRYAIHGLRGGVHHIAANGSQTPYRLWTADAAPPLAQGQVLNVSDSTVARGQILGHGPLLAIGLIGLTAWGIYELSDDDDSGS